MNLAPAAIDALAMARWQFAITTVYHFVLVPLTIGLSLLVAIMQTLWHKTGREEWLKATRFFGKLLLINFALGVSTGIVQEFQFGMNWSEYSRNVGDIFGAPLAIEALLAFFLESTFLGLWIFGWGRLSKGWHLATIWLTAIGTAVSALWILGANSWMQHPTGALFNPETGRAELNGISGFAAVVGNPVLLWEYTHVIVSSWLVAGTFVAGLSVWWMIRSKRSASPDGTKEAESVWRPVARFGLIITLIAGVLTVATGHFQGQEIAKFQPMKMAVAEGICVDTPQAAFTVASFGDCPLGNEGRPTQFIQIPKLTSFMETNDTNSTIEGVKDTQNRMVKLLNSNENFVNTYGDASQYDYRPPQMLTFWSFRIMIGLGLFSAILAVWGLWATRKNKVSKSKWLSRFALLSIPMPFLASSFGWIFTEVGRQPWVVSPNLAALANNDPVGSVLMLTEAGVSTAVPGVQVLLTTILFTILYGVLGVVWFLLIKRYGKEGIHTHSSTADDKHTTNEDSAAGALSFGY